MKYLKSLFVVVMFFILLPSYSYGDEREDREKYKHSKNVFPSIIKLPTGFRAEGIAKGRKYFGYAGSLRNGDIYKFDFRTGLEIATFKGEPGDVSLGLAFDKKNNNLFVAGLLNGTVTVYDAKHGDKLAIHHVSPPGGLVNDGIVTKDAAYFTDSLIPQIYRIPLKSKKHDEHHNSTAVIPLTGDFEFIQGQINANGIEETKNKQGLYVINSYLGILYFVDKMTGVSTLIPISGGDLINGDGLFLDGDRLYISQNFFNQVSVVELSDDGMSGKIVEVINDSRFKIPTTVTIFRDGLYVINSHFDISPPPLPGVPEPDPNIEYEIIRVDIENHD